MKLTKQIAEHFQQLHYGGNPTGMCFQDALRGITWQQAIEKVETFNTIAALTFHVNYYVQAVLKVLSGGRLDAHDKFSYDVPMICSDADWDALLNKFWQDAEAFGFAVEDLPEERLWETFVLEKYGNYYRNLLGIIEHSHYHLGQIVLIKKLLSSRQ